MVASQRSAGPRVFVEGRRNNGPSGSPGMTRAGPDHIVEVIVTETIRAATDQERAEWLTTST